MINYVNKEIIYNGCPGCAYARHEFELPCGIAYEDERFILSQDWEIPIEGFFIVSLKRHVERISDLTEDERNELFNIAVKTIGILKTNNVCDEFDIFLEDKNDNHLHLWVLPIYDWMSNLAGKDMNNLGTVIDYAKENFSNEETYERIKNITELVKNNYK